MKLLFASDLHGSVEATERVLQRFEQHQADWLILLGDLMYHGPRNPLPAGYAPAQVAALLNPYKDKIIAVRGNCESEVDQMLLHFPVMADYQQVLLSARRIFLTHGHLYNPQSLPPLAAGDILAYGHTHLPVAEMSGDIIVFNPGSAALPKGGFPASYGLLADNRLQVLALDTQSAIAAITIDA
ncbi:MAG: phosphodiesterase [Plesiomonas sp.]